MNRILLSRISIYTLGLAFMTSFVAASSLSLADDWGKFEGAVWRAKLTPQTAARGPKRAKAVPVSGHYRAEKHVLYQSENRKDEKLERKIGKTDPQQTKRGLAAEVTFNDFSVHNREEKVNFKISGKAIIYKTEKEQKGSGVFVDSDGYKWDIEIARIRE